MKTAILSIAALIAAGTGTASAGDLLVEAENFDRKGGWVVDQQFMDLMGSPYLLAHGMGRPVEDAETAITRPVRETARSLRLLAAQWSIPEGTVIEGSYAVFEAQSLSQQMHTVTWKIGEDTLVETYRFGEKITPPAVADQGELVFSGFSPAVPHIMPNYDMTFTALFAPRHEHFFKQTGFYGTCTEGLTIVSTCACGATREEKQAPSNHQFKAIIGTVDSNKLTDTLVCDFCGASEGHTLSFQTVTTAGRRTTIADLNLEKNILIILSLMVLWFFVVVKVLERLFLLYSIHKSVLISITIVFSVQM